MIKLWLRRLRGTKTVLVPQDAPVDFCEASCEAYGSSTLIEVDASEARVGSFPVRLKDDERPGCVQVWSARPHRLLHSIAPPSAVGPRGLEIGALYFSVYVKQDPKDVFVVAKGAIDKYAVIKVKKTDTRK